MIGQLQEIGPFPVKSMLGEAPERVRIVGSGIVGDRAHALVDVATGKVASAKDPRLWRDLLAFRATYVGEPAGGAPVEITFPDGKRVRSDDLDAAARIDAAVGRAVRLRSTPPAEPGYDYVWEVDDIAPAGVVTGSQTGVTEEGRPLSLMPEGVMAPGTFQDVAPITVMTTAALAAMARHHQGGRWEQARFRSNLVVDVAGDDVVENGWVGRRLAIGTAVLR